MRVGLSYLQTAQTMRWGYRARKAFYFNQPALKMSSDAYGGFRLIHDTETT